MGNDNKRDNQGLENERRIDHLENLVEKKTRTERHLEEHSDISSSPENIEHAKQLQQVRQQEIDNIKNKVAHGENSSNDYLENTQKRYNYTEGYLEHNASDMDKEDLKNAKERQNHRKDQIDQLK